MTESQEAQLDTLVRYGMPVLLLFGLLMVWLFGLGNDSFFYYVALASLLLEAASCVFVLIVSVVQLVKVNTQTPKIKNANISIALQMLQALVMLVLAGAIYYWLIRNELAPPWVAVLAAGALAMLDSLLRDFHRKRLPL